MQEHLIIGTETDNLICMTNARHSRNIFFLLFAISGFSGLIYESIWTHYLKLFLGHAAYAQTLVLAIFMGGMAIGAWLCSRISTGWRNLLLAYAIVEGIIGICAIAFHPLFQQVLDISYDTVIPQLGSASAIVTFKWGLATLLILPQSIMLGMTFPLMSAGIIRRYPQTPGGSIALLYFANSIGGAIGVLASGFVMIKWLGLPGTIVFAGIVNIVLAAIVWHLTRHDPRYPPVMSGTSAASTDGGWQVTLMAVALLTGCASFIYEIGWIRMLSLVLGSSTHAFELMLSAFILGLAFGGLWVHRRIDRLADSLGFLAWVQILMGGFALMTLVLYGNTFEVMQWLLGALDKTSTGYTLFNLGSHGIAMAIMLPATFCAGMTLPLITFSLLRKGYGERSIGAVYSANTVGAIIGILFAVHVGMPMLGLKNLIVVGAAIDILLGLYLLWRLHGARRISLPAVTVAASIAVAGVMLWVELDMLAMASGVYRARALLDHKEDEVVAHKDGKTASIALTRNQEHNLMIRTNGKVDAAANLKPGRPYLPDEPTMVLAGALPVLMYPQARTAANIGLGSGMTSHTLLAWPGLETVDTIEIEQAMVDLARGFGHRNERVYQDRRSRIHIDDAKTFFSTHQKRYDIIVSEPSNPWVSGVAGLFSREFYQLARRHLTENGLLLQWVQLYEINFELVISILKALSSEFGDYVIYASNNGDILIIATNGVLPRTLNDKAFDDPGFAADLAVIGIRSVRDVEMHKITDKAMLQPLLDIQDIPANSDYYPVLDQHAAQARFMEHNATEIIAMTMEPLPLRDMFGLTSSRDLQGIINPQLYYPLSEPRQQAQNLGRVLLEGAGVPVPAESRQQAMHLRSLFTHCQMPQHGDRIYEMYSMATLLVPLLSSETLQAIWNELLDPSCVDRMHPMERAWLDLIIAVGNRDAREMAARAERLLAGGGGLTQTRTRYLIATAMLGYIAQGRPDAARAIWERFSPGQFEDKPPSITFRLLKAHSGLH